MQSALDYFMAHCVAQTPQPKKLRSAVPVDGDRLDFDTLSILIASAWRVDAHAPRLAAVASSWALASKEAAKLVRCEDIPVPRKLVTQHPSQPMEPTLTINEEAAITNWGALPDLDQFISFRVLAVGVRSGHLTNIPMRIERDDIQSTLCGGYLNSFIINSFMASIMPDLVLAAEAAIRGEETCDFYIPTTFTQFLGAQYDLFQPIKRSLAQAMGSADCVHVPLHFTDTETRCQHWVHVRAKKSVKKVEIFESAMLVESTFVGWRLLDALVEAGALDDVDGWTVVLYNRGIHKMPRQSDGSSCGIFTCVVAAHLVAGRRLPRNIQENVHAWRRYVAAKVWAAAPSD